MNTNQIINLTVFLSIIAIIISIVIINKIIKNRRYDSIKNKANNHHASNGEIKLAYKYETGKYSYDANKKDGSDLEYKAFKILYRCGGKVLSNLYTGTKNSNINQSDVVFIHNTGIYVIECKDTDAISVIGDEGDKDWIYIFNSNYQEERHNPLRQNLGHINSLKNMLSNKYSNEYYVSVIVLNCKNINITYESNSSNFYQSIVTPPKLDTHIKSLINSRKIILTYEQVMDIYKYLHENCANVSEEIKSEHIKNIKRSLEN